MLTNWAGNHAYRAEQVLTPASVEELQQVVTAHERVRALGSRHSFTDLADTTGTLVSTAGLPGAVQIDEGARTVSVGGGTRYGDLAVALHEAGWALATMASLPHISVAGAVATGTHGSGDHTGSLASAVAAVELVRADGTVELVRRGEPDFAGHVVSVGALGIVTRITLDIEPTYDMRVDLWTELPWSDVADHFDELSRSGDSVSLFTRWQGDAVEQVWLKRRDPVDAPAQVPTSLWGAGRASGTMHMLAGADLEALTDQGGLRGPWHERLPHFRLGFTPSRGEELQSEYLLPRSHALAAVEELRRLGPRLEPYLQIGEIRTIARDDLWLSGAYGTQTVAFHFTWDRDVPGVYSVLPAMEEVLLPLGARPHWGKCFVAGADALRAQYPRFDDFVALARRVDPAGRFRNDWTARHLGL